MADSFYGRAILFVEVEEKTLFSQRKEVLVVVYAPQIQLRRVCYNNYLRM